MYLLIRYPGGIIAEGVVLAKGRNRLRVAVAGFPDAIEMRRTRAQWFDTNGEPVEFDFLMSDAHQTVTAPASKAVGLTIAAGSPSV